MRNVSSVEDSYFCCACTCDGADDVWRTVQEKHRMGIMFSFWPFEPLNTTFNFNNKEYTYDPEQFGGPVYVPLTLTELGRAGAKDIEAGFPGVRTVLLMLQLEWFRQVYPLEADIDGDSHEMAMMALQKSTYK